MLFCYYLANHFFLFFFFLMIRRPPRSTLFPYTTALPIYRRADAAGKGAGRCANPPLRQLGRQGAGRLRGGQTCAGRASQDRKSTRLNSSHSQISYAVFCLKKKNNTS